MGGNEANEVGGRGTAMLSSLSPESKLPSGEIRVGRGHVTWPFPTLGGPSPRGMIRLVICSSLSPHVHSLLSTFEG